MQNDLSGFFSAISSDYDILNRILSFNQDKRWRRKAVIAAEIPENARILDLCTGTADSAIELARKNKNSQVFGVDFSPAMLNIAGDKIARLGIGKRLHLVQADVFSLPFQEGYFDAVFISFGLRNLIDYQRSLGEMVKMLKSGGSIIILEFSPAQNNLIGKIIGFYIKNILPRFASIFGGSRQAYEYLPASINAFLSPEMIFDYMFTAGLRKLRRKDLCCGIVNSYYGQKIRKV